MLCPSLKGQGRNSDWNLVRESCVKRLCGGSWDFVFLDCVGRDSGEQILASLSCFLPMPPTGSTNWNSTRNRGQGAGGGGRAIHTSQPPGTQDREKGTEYVGI